jgi:hypothetical protein
VARADRAGQIGMQLSPLSGRPSSRLWKSCSNGIGAWPLHVSTYPPHEVRSSVTTPTAGVEDRLSRRTSPSVNKVSCERRNEHVANQTFPPLTYAKRETWCLPSRLPRSRGQLFQASGLGMHICNDLAHLKLSGERSCRPVRYRSPRRLQQYVKGSLPWTDTGLRTAPSS